MNFLFLSLVLGAAPVQKTTIGIYVDQIAAVDLKANTYQIDFWIWFRSRGYETSPIDTFEIIDGRIESKTNFIRKKLPNGEDYAAARVMARIHQEWDLRKYPLDDHSLRIVIEDSERDVSTAVFTPDEANQGIDPSVSVAGWSIAGLRSEVGSHRYESNFGDVSVSEHAETHYSRYVVSLDIKRGSVARFFKVVFALLVSVLVSWFAFFLHPSVGARVSVPIGALFAGAAGSIAINSQLPDLQYMTITDKAVFLSLGMISFSLVASVVALNLHNRGKEALHKKIDLIGTYGFPLFYIAGIAVILS